MARLKLPCLEAEALTVGTMFDCFGGGAKLLLALLILSFSTALSAQTRCPTGVQAGGAQCLPDDEDSQPSRPTGEWLKTWGALVSSNKGHGAWSSKGKFSEDDARQDALSRCYASGVSDCNVDATYFNQCVAVVSSVEKGVSIGKGKNKSVAGSVALKDCQGRGNSECAIEFSDCTEPFFKKY